MNLGGKITTYLKQEDGYAAYNVLVNTGATVVINDINQIERDFTFGSGGGVLDLNGSGTQKDGKTVFTWDNTVTDVNADGFTIHALTEEALITNTSTTKVTLNVTAPQTVYKGSFSGNMDVVYQGTGDWTLHSIHTNLDDGCGFTVTNGKVILSGVNTEHGMGSVSGTNTNRLVNTRDWHYADATMNVEVASGATFELGSHARLTGDVTVASGGTYIMREGVKLLWEYVEGGQALEETSKYAEFYGHKGDISLESGAKLEIAYNDGVNSKTSYAGNIKGARDVSIALGTSGAQLTLSGDNEFSGTNTLSSGTLVGSDLHALGVAGTDDTTKWLVESAAVLAVGGVEGTDDTTKWLVESAAVIAVGDAAGLLPHITGKSTGVLALMQDMETELDLANNKGLIIGALAGCTVNYGKSSNGSYSTLKAYDHDGDSTTNVAWVLGGGGGELIVHFKLIGDNDLILGNEYGKGKVTLANLDNDISGNIIFKGLVTLDYVVGENGSTALGENATLNLNYGNRAYGHSGTTNFATDSEGTLLMDRISGTSIDLSGHGNLHLGSSTEDATLSGITTASDYKFGGSTGKLTVDVSLGDVMAEDGTTIATERNLIVDGQTYSGGVIHLAQAATLTGKVTVMGYDERKPDLTEGDITLSLGVEDALANAASVIVKDGGIIDLAGNNQYFKSLTLGSTGTVFDSFVNDSGATLSIDSGELSGALVLSHLEKTGDGELTLGGEAYIRLVSVKGGELTIGSSNLSMERMIIENERTVSINGQTINGQISAAAGHTGYLTGSGTIGATGGIGADEGGTLILQGGTLLLNSIENNRGGGTVRLLAGRMEIGNVSELTMFGTLSVEADATLFSNRGSNDSIRTFETIQVAAEKTLKIDENNWNTIWNISHLNGEGNVEWNSDTNHWYSSRIVLGGEGNLSGVFTYTRNFNNSARKYQSYLELAHDRALQNADLVMDGGENSYAALAVNTANAQVKSLSGDEYSVLYSGSAVAGNGENNETNPISVEPTSTSSNTLTINGGGTASFSGTVSGSESNALSIAMIGTGTQTFSGTTVVKDVTAKQGSLEFSGSWSVLGDVAVAKGASLTLSGGFTLGEGHTFSVLNGSGTSACLNNSLTLNGGTISFSSEAFSSDQASLSLEGVIKGDDFTSQIVNFFDTSALLIGEQYYLSNGDWSDFSAESFTAEMRHQYMDATFNTDSTGLRVTFSAKEGNLIWNGTEDKNEWNDSVFAQHSGVKTTDIVVFNDSASIKDVNVTGEITVGSMIFDNTEAYVVSGSGLITTESLLVLSGGDVTIGSNLSVKGETTVQGALTLSGDAKIDGTLSVSDNGTANISGTTNTVTTLNVADGTMNISGNVSTIETLNITAGTVDISGTTNTIGAIIQNDGVGTLNFTAGEAIVDSYRGVHGFKNTEVNIEQGASVTVKYDFILRYQQQTNTSTLNVRGLMSVGGTLWVARDGHGVVNIEDGASVKTGTLKYGANPGWTGNQKSSTVNLNAGGTLVVDAITITAAANNEVLNFNGGTFGTSANNLDVNAGGLTIALGKGTSSTINTGKYVDGAFSDTATTIKINNVLSGAGLLVKTGAGTLDLAGANTYTGGTTISAGTLVANHAQALGTTGNALLAAGATLRVGDGIALALGSGNHVISGNVVLSENAITNNGTVTVGSTATFDITNLTATDNAYIIINGGEISDWDTLKAYNFVQNGYTLARDSVNVSTDGVVTLGTGTAATLTWAGTSSDPDTTSNDWDNATKNWTNNGVFDQFYTGDSVVFDSGEESTNAITVESAVTVGNLTVKSGSVSFSGSNVTANQIIVNGGTLAFSSVLNGDIVVKSGTLNIQGGDQVFDNNLTIDGGTVNVNLTDSLAYGASNTITINDGELAFGNKRFTVGADNKFVINGGTITGAGQDANGALDFYEANDVAVHGDATISAAIRLRNVAVDFDIDTGKKLTISGIINGGGTLVKSGEGTLTLSGHNTYSSRTVVSGGTLRVDSLGWGNKGNIGTLFTDDGLVISGGTLEVTKNQTTTGNTYGTGGALRGLTISGTGTYYYSGTSESDTGESYISPESGKSIRLVNGKDSNFILQVAEKKTLYVTGAIQDNVAGSTQDEVPGYTDGALTKAGAGTLVLSGANLYTGGTTIEAGTLTVSGAGTLGTGAVTVAENATLSLTGTATFGNAITNHGMITSSGFNALSGSVSGGLLNVEANTLTLNGASNNKISSSITVKEGATLSVASAEKFYEWATFTLTLDGGNLVVGKGKRQVLGEEVTIVLNGGTISEADGGTNGDTYGAIDLGGSQSVTSTREIVVNDNTTISASLRLRSNIEFNVVADKTLTLSGIIDPNGDTAKYGSQKPSSLVKTGDGTMVISGTSTNYNSGLTVSGGKVQLTGSLGGTITIDESGRLGLSGQIELNNEIINDGTITSNSTNTLNGVISGSGSLLVEGGELTVNGEITASGISVVEDASARFNNQVVATDLTTITGVTTNGTNNLTLAGGLNIASGKRVEISGATISHNVGENGYIINGTMRVTGNLNIALNSGTNRVTIASGAEMILTDGAIINRTNGAYWGQGSLIVEENATASFNSNDDYHLSYSATGGNITLNAGSTLNFQVNRLNLSNDSNYVGSINIGKGATFNLSATGSAYLNTQNTLNISGGTFAVNNGTTTIQGAVTLTNGGTFAAADGKTITVNGAISGTGPLNKSGAGTLTLTSTNSYSGGTTINGGTLKITNEAALGSGSITVEQGGTLELAVNMSDTTYQYVLNGGTLNSTVSTSNGEAQISDGNAITLNANSTIKTDQNMGMIASGHAANTLTLNGYTLTKSGSNSFWLSNTRITAGTIDITAGSITLVNNQNNGMDGSAADFVLSSNAGTLNLNGFNFSVKSLSGTSGTVSLGSRTLTIAGTSEGTDIYSFAGTIDGANGHLVKNGNEILELKGNTTLSSLNAAAGATTISGGTTTIGTLNFGGTANLNANATITTINGGGTLNVENGAAVTATEYTNYGAAATITVSENSELRFSDKILVSTGGSNVTLKGAGEITANTVYLGNSNTSLMLSDDITLTLGSGGFAAHSNLSSGSKIIIGNATLVASIDWNVDLTPSSSNNTSLTNAFVLNGAAKFNTNEYTITFGANLADKSETKIGSLTKLGTGTLELAGANTYTGGTRIEEGTIELSGSGTLGDVAGAVTIAGGSGHLTIGDDVTVSNAVTILVGESNIENAIISGSGTLSLGSGKITIQKVENQQALSLAASVYQYQIVDANSKMDNSWTRDSFTLDGWGEGWFVQNYENGLLTLAIPEPTTFGFLSGLAALVFVGGRRRKRMAR